MSKTKAKAATAPAFDVIAEFEKTYREKENGFGGDPEVIEALRRNRRHQFTLFEHFGDDWHILLTQMHSRDEEQRNAFAERLTEKYRELLKAEARGGAVIGLKRAASRAELDDILCDFHASRSRWGDAQDLLLQAALGVDARRAKVKPESLRRQAVAEKIVEFADWHNAPVSDRAISDYLGMPAHTAVAEWRRGKKSKRDDGVHREFLRGVRSLRWLRENDPMSPDYINPNAPHAKAPRPVHLK